MTNDAPSRQTTDAWLWDEHGNYCPDCQKTLDQFDIRFPASRSFVSCLIACEAVQSPRPRHSCYPKDTRHFPIREWFCLAADLSTRRILSCVLQEQYAPILPGYWRIVGYYLQIQKDLRLYGGPSRERIILHRRNAPTNPILDPN